MAGRILARVLRALDSIYDIQSPAAVAPSSIDTASPLQLVHDTSREAELGSGVGQFAGLSEGAITVGPQTGAGVTRTTLSQGIGATATGAPWNVEPRDLDDWCWWVLDAWGAIENDGNQGNLVACQLWAWNGLNTTQFMGTGNTNEMSPRIIFNTAGAVSGGGTDMLTGPTLYTGLNHQGQPFRPFPVPYRGPSDDWLQLVVNRSGDLGRIRVGLLYWYGPVGVTPPGVR